MLDIRLISSLIPVVKQGSIQGTLETHLHSFLADRLTLYQPEGADYAHRLVASPKFFGSMATALG